MSMTFYKFNEINEGHQFLGGKAYALGLLSNAKFPVPIGAVCSEYPQTENEWNEIFSWWKSVGSPKLAIRSSAQGEDSGEQSFAGQNSTFLNVEDEASINSCLLKCFESMNKKSSSLYREHFLKEKSSLVKMNVVLQEMVDPLYSGVFFSLDPRHSEKSWICEAITGYGEDLVSGKKTPLHFNEENQKECEQFNLALVVNTGLAVRDYFGFEIDMEWAINTKGEFKVLQARPITAINGKSFEKKIIYEEILKLKKEHPHESLWDGQTFAEWSGPPTELTFSLWKKAFSKDSAFSKALESLGYVGIKNELQNDSHSLLERVLGRGYINLSLMAPLYFGSIPYKMIADPKPHLKFDFHKMTFKNFLETPLTLWKMISIGWKLSTERREILNSCQKNLIEVNAKLTNHLSSQHLMQMSDAEILNLLKVKAHFFSKDLLVSPLTLIVLIESTLQSLRSLLSGVLSEKEIELILKKWMSKGLHTQTMQMNEDYLEASLNQNKRESFLKHYGHRGPGELELSHPRWGELGEKIFYSIKNKSSSKVQDSYDIKTDILSLKTYKKLAILKEWELLKEMLELRESWKMTLLLPYNDIRLLSLEIAKRKQWENEHIFWCSLDEIINDQMDINLARTRKEKVLQLKSISLPGILSLNDLESIFLNNNNNTNNSDQQKKLSQSIQGTPLSSGVVFGEVRVVNDPENVNTDLWPENVILVAESTDPGWTGLFLKSVAIIVEKGGVLSHCAIVAREMNLPAVSEIKQCHLRYKDGDLLWVDGNNGLITSSL